MTFGWNLFRAFRQLRWQVVRHCEQDLLHLFNGCEASPSRNEYPIAPDAIEEAVPSLHCTLPRCNFLLPACKGPIRPRLHSTLVLSFPFGVLCLNSSLRPAPIGESYASVEVNQTSYHQVEQAEEDRVSIVGGMKDPCYDGADRSQDQDPLEQSNNFANNARMRRWRELPRRRWRDWPNGPGRGFEVLDELRLRLADAQAAMAASILPEESW